jgi:4'-phosphopantetheinyl transferase
VTKDADLIMPIAVHSASPQLVEYWGQLSAQEILCLGILLPAHSPRLEENLASLVSDGERQRANNFRHPDDRLRHLLGRAVLRQTLALPDIELPLNPWGKPEFPGEGVHFNISHGGREVWVAMSKSTSVGIDVEEENIPDAHDLALSLHPDEAEAIRSLPPHQAASIFCRCWTRKEAVLKALGQGLSIPLKDFRVATDNRPHDWLLQSTFAAGQSWTVADLPVSPGHYCAIAAQAPVQVPKILRLEPSRSGFAVIRRTDVLV